MFGGDFVVAGFVPALKPSDDSQAIVDAGCTSHFIGPNKPCNNKVPTNHGIYVRLTNGDTMQSTHTAMLLFPQLTIAAHQAHVFPSLQNKSLLSIGKFCYSNFTAFFRKGHVQLSRDGITIPGQRDRSTGLYFTGLPHLPLAAPPRHSKTLPSAHMK